MNANKKKLLIALPIAAVLVIVCVLICLLNSCGAYAPPEKSNGNSSVISSGDESGIPGLTYTITKSSEQNSSNINGNRASRYTLIFNTSPSTNFSLKGRDYSIDEKTDVKGSFSVFDLPAGEYTLTINGKTITIIVSDEEESSSLASNNSSNSSLPNNSSISTDSIMPEESSSSIPLEESSDSEKSPINDSDESTETSIDSDFDASQDDVDYDEDLTAEPSNGSTSNNTGSGSGSTSQVPQHTHSYTTPVYEEVLVKAGYSEQVLVKEAWDEQILVEEAYDEYVNTGKTYVECYCGLQFDKYEEWCNHNHQYGDNIQSDEDIEEFMKHQGYSTHIKYDMIHHEAEYKIIHHEAEYETVEHDPVYETQVVGYACSCGVVK